MNDRPITPLPDYVPGPQSARAQKVTHPALQPYVASPPPAALQPSFFGNFIEKAIHWLQQHQPAATPPAAVAPQTSAKSHACLADYETGKKPVCEPTTKLSEYVAQQADTSLLHTLRNSLPGAHADAAAAPASTPAKSATKLDVYRP